jgi:GTP cyclohydrolase I
MLSNNEIIRYLIRIIGDDPNREELRELPQRLLRLYQNFFTYRKVLKVVNSYERNMITDKNVIPITIFEDKKIDTLILKQGKFVSICEHHLLPFWGKYIFVYLPDGMVVGLSKIDDIVRYFSGRLQIQERLASNIVDWFMENVKPQGCMIVMEGYHTCEYLTKGEMGKFTTSAIRGAFVKDKKIRNEALELMGK